MQSVLKELLHTQSPEQINESFGGTLAAVGAGLVRSPMDVSISPATPSLVRDGMELEAVVR